MTTSLDWYLDHHSLLAVMIDDEVVAKPSSIKIEHLTQLNDEKLTFRNGTVISRLPKTKIEITMVFKDEPAKNLHSVSYKVNDLHLRYEPEVKIRIHGLILLLEFVKVKAFKLDRSSLTLEGYLINADPDTIDRINKLGMKGVTTKQKQ